MSHWRLDLFYDFKPKYNANFNNFPLKIVWIYSKNDTKKWLSIAHRKKRWYTKVSKFGVGGCAKEVCVRYSTKSWRIRHWSYTRSTFAWWLLAVMLKRRRAHYTMPGTSSVWVHQWFGPMLSMIPTTFSWSNLTIPVDLVKSMSLISNNLRMYTYSRR